MIRFATLIACSTVAFAFYLRTFAEEAECICRYHTEGTVSSQLPIGIEYKGNGRRYAPDRQVDVLHIKLDVVPDFSKRTVSGTTTLTFAPISKQLSTLTLDAVNLSIKDVRSQHAIADFISTENDLTIVFREADPRWRKGRNCD